MGPICSVGILSAEALVEVNNKGSRRVVSDLGEILMKQ